jgi:hypothetical protein
MKNIFINGTEINVETKKSTGYNAAIERADFFQQIQIWPLNNVLNYKGWLNNFSEPKEQEIACHILNFFMFYPKAMINQMLKTLIGYCGNFLASYFPNWQYNDFREKCFYSFIPGETKNPTDSGHIYVRKLRSELHIPEQQIVDYNKLYLLENNSDPIPVILVDDFVGSGAQCDKAWNTTSGQEGSHSLSEIASTSNHMFIYAPIVANHIGYDRIKSTCKGLTLVTCHKLNNEYNLFDPHCICWKHNEELYAKGVELILSKSKELGIPFTDGENVVDAKGFCEQGLALAFDDDGVPDAIPAIFYWCNDSWIPLIKKEYQR